MNNFTLRKRIFVSPIVLLLLVVLVSNIPLSNAQFVLSEHTWSYPDEYGQGVEYIYFMVANPDPYNASYQYFNGTESAGFDVPRNSTISLRVHVWMNGTFTGYSFAEGRDQYTRVGLVISVAGETIFSQVNLTQSGGSSAHDPMFEYDYTFLLRGAPNYYSDEFVSGQIYVLDFTYEVYY